MRWISLFALMTGLAAAGQVIIGPVKIPRSTTPKASSPMGDFFDLSAVDIHGDSVRMDRYRGHKVLVVNTASECGNTPQYTQLEHLYEEYKDRGLVIIGFPCDQFGGQEPGTEADIEAFCTKNYGVTFPMMSKIEVKGPGKHPVYQWLTEREHNGKLDAEVTWNFQKFLIDEKGQLVTTVAPDTDPTTPVIMNWLEDKR
jgi:glutathione peroxidase